MRTTLTLALLAFTALPTLGGCGRFYHLPGHAGTNLHDPPDLTMRAGQRRKAISTGFAIKALGPAGMESSKPDVVAVEPADDTGETVYLRARKPGVATVRYTYDTYSGVHHRSGVNDGFEVRVVPAR